MLNESQPNINAMCDGKVKNELQRLRLRCAAFRGMVLRLSPDYRPLPPLPARGGLYRAEGGKSDEERKRFYETKGMGHGEGQDPV